ncbi:hypothetical protein [Nonomuraea sp. NPDC048916]
MRIPAPVQARNSVRYSTKISGACVACSHTLCVSVPKVAMATVIATTRT